MLSKKKVQQRSHDKVQVRTTNRVLILVMAWLMTQCIPGRECWSGHRLRGTAPLDVVDDFRHFDLDQVVADVGREHCPGHFHGLGGRDRRVRRGDFRGFSTGAGTPVGQSASRGPRPVDRICIWVRGGWRHGVQHDSAVRVEQHGRSVARRKSPCGGFERTRQVIVRSR